MKATSLCVSLFRLPKVFKGYMKVGVFLYNFLVLFGVMLTNPNRDSATIEECIDQLGELI